EQAGLRSGMLVQRMAIAGEETVEVESFEQLRWELTQAAMSGAEVTLWASRSAGQDSESEPYRLLFSGLVGRELNAELQAQIGITAPWSAPVLGEIVEQGAAARAGLRPADRVLSVDQVAVDDAQQLRAIIRNSLAPSGEARTQRWTVERDGRLIELEVRPDPQGEGEQRAGRIGAYVGAAPASVTLSRELLPALRHGFERTAAVSSLTLEMIGRMLVGLASLENLSGPIAIADQAGKSAEQGGVAYLSFLALISVSLGVLNLLPLPVLDGGHLLYYLVEAFTGRPVSGVWLERLQRAGMAILLALMCLAFLNDIARLLG
ncbi:MAG: hypothetical protein RLZZ555_2040, partial [Pseudomonadota bacterium]